jgi:hypothetical protein
MTAPSPSPRAVDRFTRFQLPSSAAVGKVESAFDEFLKSCEGSPQDLEIDMSACEFVEPATLTYLTALMRARRREAKKTRLKLPRAKDVRDFFRAWEFPRAVHDAIGSSFASMVCPEDIHYFGESHTLEDVKYRGTLVQGGRDRMPFVGTYGIKTFFSASVISGEALAKNESKSWKEEHIVTVLNRHLQGLGKRVASHIIHEAMMNALRHPAATLIQTTSHFEWPDDSNPASKGFLTIVLWDDGESVSNTLSRAIAEGQNISSVRVPRLYANYHFVVENENGVKEPAKVICSDLIPDATTPNEELLLAATFPGITRDPAGFGHDADAELAAEDEMLSRPGMGLYVLTNTAVDVFGGTVSVRTKNLFMNIKPPGSGRGRKDKCQYRVKVRRYGAWMPEFLGNMITIRLPLAKPTVA